MSQLQRSGSIDKAKLTQMQKLENFTKSILNLQREINHCKSMLDARTEVDQPRFKILLDRYLEMERQLNQQIEDVVARTASPRKKL